MGKITAPYSVKLFLAVMYQHEETLEKALAKFSQRFGDRDPGSVILEVNRFTKYYDSEMGMGLKKIYLTFKKPIDRTLLPEIKNFTNLIEEQFMINGLRAVNLDPGYISRDKLVLASTKNFYQRIYLENGVYAEMTMHYRGGRFRYFSWTYPDYKDPDVRKLLEKGRADVAGIENSQKRDVK